MKIPPMCNPLLAPQQPSAQALQPDAAQRTSVAAMAAMATAPMASAAMERSKTLSVKPLQASQLAKLGISPAWTVKNPTFNDLMQNYSPRNWGVVADSPWRAYRWQCPTVAALSELYGAACPKMWMDEQVTHLFLTSQCRDASQAEAQVGPFVAAFTGTVAGYKLSEVMLFFARYKAGVYGQSFAAFDVRNVGQTFHHDFLKDRRRELTLMEERDAAERMMRERELRQDHALSREAYFALRPTDVIHLVVELNPSLPASWLKGTAALFGLADTEALTGAITKREWLEVDVPFANMGRIVELGCRGAWRVLDSALRR